MFFSQQMMPGQLDINAYKNKFRYTLRTSASVSKMEGNPGWLPMSSLGPLVGAHYTHIHRKRKNKKWKQLWKKRLKNRKDKPPNRRNTQNVTGKGFAPKIHKECLKSTGRWQTSQLKDRLVIWMDTTKNVWKWQTSPGQLHNFTWRWVIMSEKKGMPLHAC